MWKYKSPSMKTLKKEKPNNITSDDDGSELINSNEVNHFTEICNNLEDDTILHIEIHSKHVQLCNLIL